jgi:hypothetical protein
MFLKSTTKNQNVPLNTTVPRGDQREPPNIEVF